MDTVDALLGFIDAEVGAPESVDPVLSRLMRRCARPEREALLRERMGGTLREYRELMVRTIRAEQARASAFDSASAEAVATMLGAVGDRLLTHVLCRRRRGVDASRALLAPRGR